MQTQLLMPAAIGLVVSWLACFVVRRQAARWGWLDAPDARKNHAAPTPLGGGFGIAAGVLIAGLLGGWRSLFDAFTPLAGALLPLSPTMALALGAAVMLALGAIDDRRHICWKRRMAVELLVAAAFSLSLGAAFADMATTPWVLALAAVWIVAQLNALNMLDNMDALAGGVGAIAAAFLAVLALDSGIDEAAPSAEPLRGVAHTLAALCGALGGFLWHNRTPARLFMGDAGSYFTGFLLAASSVMLIAGAADSGFARLAPVCALATPLYDMVSVVAIRLAQGRSPFAADHSHVSHRLVALGCSRRSAVQAIQAATFAAGFASLVVQRGDARTGGLALATVLLAMVAAAGSEIVLHRRRIARDH